MTDATPTEHDITIELKARAMDFTSMVSAVDLSLEAFLGSALMTGDPGDHPLAQELLLKRVSFANKIDMFRTVLKHRGDADATALKKRLDRIRVARNDVSHQFMMGWTDPLSGEAVLRGVDVMRRSHWQRLSAELGWEAMLSAPNSLVTASDLEELTAEARSVAEEIVARTLPPEDAGGE